MQANKYIWMHSPSAWLGCLTKEKGRRRLGNDGAGFKLEQKYAHFKLTHILLVRQIEKFLRLVGQERSLGARDYCPFLREVSELQGHCQQQGQQFATISALLSLKGCVLSW